VLIDQARIDTRFAPHPGPEDIEPRRFSNRRGLGRGRPQRVPSGGWSPFQRSITASALARNLDCEMCNGYEQHELFT
jgi:hypothetical protein